MKTFIFMIAISPIFFFIVWREFFLQKIISRLLLVIYIMMFMIYYIDYTLLFNDVKYAYILRAPLIITLLYYLFRYIFIKKFNREPRNTFWIWEHRGYLYDVLFNLLFFIITGFLLMFLITGDI